jgi:hypothetical protein
MILELLKVGMVGYAQLELVLFYKVIVGLDVTWLA